MAPAPRADCRRRVGAIIGNNERVETLGVGYVMSATDRSSRSMTAALYAGTDRKAPRSRARWRWLRTFRSGGEAEDSEVPAIAVTATATALAAEPSAVKSIEPYEARGSSWFFRAVRRLASTSARIRSANCSTVRVPPRAARGVPRRVRSSGWSSGNGRV